MIEVWEAVSDGKVIDRDGVEKKEVNVSRRVMTISEGIVKGKPSGERRQSEVFTVRGEEKGVMRGGR